MLSKGYQMTLLETHHKNPHWGSTAQRVLVNNWSVLNRVLPQKFLGLDYGCGTGQLKKTLAKLRPGAVIVEYDPGMPNKAQLPPEQFHWVFNIDVMEHVEPEYVDDVIKSIFSKALDGAFFNIACRPAKQILVDGRNAHLTIMTPAEWTKRIISLSPLKWKFQILSKSGKELTLIGGQQ